MTRAARLTSNQWIRQLGTLAVVVLSFSCIALATASQARSAVREVSPFCLTAGSIDEIWRSGELDLNWGLASGCGKVEFWLTQSPAYGAPGGVQYPSVIRESLKIDGVTAFLRGSNGQSAGAVQGVRLAWGTLPHQIGPLVTKSSDSETARTTQERVELSAEGLPAIPDRVFVTAECVDPPEAGGECPESEPLKIDSLAVSLRDDYSPVLSLRPEFSENAWLSASTKLRVDSSDQPPRVDGSPLPNGTGMQRIEFDNANGLPSSAKSWTVLSPYCGDPKINFVNCRQSLGFDQNMDLSNTARWPEGFSKLYVRAFDWAGNVTTRTVEFNVDRTSPKTPDQLQVEGETAAGWTRESQPLLSWRNADEALPGGGDTFKIEARHRLFPADANPSGAFADSLVDFGERSSKPIQFSSPGKWDVELTVRDRAGNASGIAGKTIGYDDHELDAPRHDATYWYGPSRRTIEWQSPIDLELAPSGICDYGKLVDDAPDTMPDASATPEPANSMQLPDSVAHGVHKVHVKAISCSGVDGAAAHKTFAFDALPPTVSTNAVRGEWLSDQEVLKIAAADVDAGVSGLRYRVDGGPINDVAGDQAELALSEGMRDLQIHAEDEVGNRSANLDLRVGFDRSAPIAWIGPHDPARPTLITAAAYDQHSGVESSSIQYRPAGGGEWTDLKTDSSGGREGTATFSARFPDAVLATGDYELRVSVTDFAGHTAFSDLRIDGTSASIKSPLRSDPKISLSVLERTSTKCRGAKTGSRRCSAYRAREQLIVPFGRAAIVGGRLQDPAGKPMAGVTLNVFTVREGLPVEKTSSRVDVGSVTTGRDGSFRARIAPGVNRTVIVRMPGVELLRPVEDTARVGTRASLSLSVNRRRVATGQKLVFTGRVRLGGERLSGLGLNVDIMLEGSTHSPTDGQSLTDGTFTIPYVVPDYSRPLRFKFEARVKHSRGWPYFTARSRPVTVVVLPRRR